MRVGAGVGAGFRLVVGFRFGSQHLWTVSRPWCTGVAPGWRKPPRGRGRVRVNVSVRGSASIRGRASVSVMVSVKVRVELPLLRSRCTSIGYSTIHK